MVKYINVFEMEQDKMYKEAWTGEYFRLDHKGQLERSNDGGRTFKQSNLRYKTLRGMMVYEVEDIQQFPRCGVRYYYPSVEDNTVNDYIWNDDITDYRIQASCGVYRTEEEAHAVLDCIREQFGQKTD